MGVLTDGEIGPEAEYSLLIKNGNLVMSFNLDTKGIDASVHVKLESRYFLEKLKNAIPGKIDDMIIDGLQAALLK